MFEGRAALVTGGGRGLGLELARGLGLAGARVMICGRDEDRLAAARRQIPGLETVVCDLGTPAGRTRLVDCVNERFADVSIVVHNAAIQRRLDVGSMAGDTDVLREIDVNLAAPIDLTWQLMPLLAAQPRAALVFVTSALARVPKQSAPVYCASKAGLSNFARALSYQLEGGNITVHEAVPALIRTAMTAGEEGRKMDEPGAVAEDILAGMAAGRRQILIGHTRLLYVLHRLAPGLAYGLLKQR